jgi:hypothetical protein
MVHWLSKALSRHAFIEVTHQRQYRSQQYPTDPETTETDTLTTPMDYFSVQPYQSTIRMPRKVIPQQN